MEVSEERLKAGGGELCDVGYGGHSEATGDPERVRVRIKYTDGREGRMNGWMRGRNEGYLTGRTVRADSGG